MTSTSIVLLFNLGNCEINRITYKRFVFQSKDGDSITGALKLGELKHSTLFCTYYV